MTRKLKWAVVLACVALLVGAVVYESGLLTAAAYRSKLPYVSLKTAMSRMDQDRTPHVYRVDGEVEESLSRMRCIPGEQASGTRILLYSDSDTIYVTVLSESIVRTGSLTISLAGLSGIYTCTISRGGQNLTTFTDGHGVILPNSQNFVVATRVGEVTVFSRIEVPRVLVDPGGLAIQVIQTGGGERLFWFGGGFATAQECSI